MVVVVVVVGMVAVNAMEPRLITQDRANFAESVGSADDESIGSAAAALKYHRRSKSENVSMAQHSGLVDTRDRPDRNIGTPGDGRGAQGARGARGEGNRGILLRGRGGIEGAKSPGGGDAGGDGGGGGPHFPDLFAACRPHVHHSESPSRDSHEANESEKGDLTIDLLHHPRDQSSAGGGMFAVDAGAGGAVAGGTPRGRVTLAPSPGGHARGGGEARDGADESGALGGGNESLSRASWRDAIPAGNDDDGRFTSVSDDGASGTRGSRLRSRVSGKTPSDISSVHSPRMVPPSPLHPEVSTAKARYGGMELEPTGRGHGDEDAKDGHEVDLDDDAGQELARRGSVWAQTPLLHGASTCSNDQKQRRRRRSSQGSRRWSETLSRAFHVSTGARRRSRRLDRGSGGSETDSYQVSKISCFFFVHTWLQ